MSKYKIATTYKGSPEILLTRVKTLANKYDGYINGNSEAGNFSVIVLGFKYQGHYIVKGNSIEITIDDKPFYIPGKTIESIVCNYINS